VDLAESCKAEVCDLQVHLLIDEDVLKFEIAMDDTFAVHVVENVKHLLEEETAADFAHVTEALADIEEKTAGDELEEDVDEVVDLAAGGLLHMAVRAVTNNVDDVFVLQALEDLNFLLDRLDGAGVARQELLAEQFKCDGVAGLHVPSLVDFRGVAFSEGGENLPLVVEDWVLLAAAAVA
jgi:hypothetical protein